MEGNQPNLGTREPLWQDPVLSFPLCKMRRWTGQFLKAHLLGDILAWWVLFFTSNKMVTRDCCRKMRKLILVPENALRAVFPFTPFAYWNTLTLTHTHTQECTVCTIIFHAPVTSAGAVILVTLRSALPTAPDWLGADFHCPGVGGLPALPGPVPLFLTCGRQSRAGWGAGPASPHPLRLGCS